MKKLIGLALVAGLGLATAATTANAAQGCGRGMHRTPHGRCVPNGVGPGAAFVIGNFYAGRGYWDGHRWYQHRDRWHGGWRYR